jgi:hypothetical protein
MLLAAVIVEIFSRKRTLAAGLLITGLCTAALIASPAQVGSLEAQNVVGKRTVDTSVSVTNHVQRWLMTCAAGLPVGQQGRCHGRVCSVVHIHARGVALGVVHAISCKLAAYNHCQPDVATLCCSIQHTMPLSPDCS